MDQAIGGLTAQECEPYQMGGRHALRRTRGEQQFLSQRPNSENCAARIPGRKKT
jgi:hypothetical protein